MKRGVLLVLAIVGVLFFAVVVTAAVAMVRRDSQIRALRAHYRAQIIPLYHGAYSPAGYPVGPLETNIRPPTVTLSENGLPVVKYPVVGYRTNPVTIEQYGLWAYGEYVRTHSPKMRATVLLASDWLVANQRDGRWWYAFDFNHDGWSLKAPWSSAMAQGQAMSLLERAFRLTGKRSYLRTAIRAVKPVETSVAKGGLERCFFGNCGLPFYEEYPSDPPSYVLNGFMFTLVGLYDLASVAPGSSAGADFEHGMKTLRTILPRYDYGGIPSYALSQVTIKGQAVDPAPAYHPVVVYLLNALNSVRPSPILRTYAKRWAATI